MVTDLDNLIPDAAFLRGRVSSATGATCIGLCHVKKQEHAHSAVGLQER